MSLLVAILLLIQPADPAPAAPRQAEHYSSCSSIETPHGTTIVDRLAPVFFETASAAITARGAAALDGFLAGYDAPAYCEVVIDGHADRAGPADRNLRLSERRANAVAAYLRQKGLAAPIVIGRHGETQLLVETPDGVAQPENRYVVVWVNDPPATPR